jgi:hypothetical protein
MTFEYHNLYALRYPACVIYTVPVPEFVYV